MPGSNRPERSPGLKPAVEREVVLREPAMSSQSEETSHTRTDHIGQEESKRPRLALLRRDVDKDRCR